MFEMWIWRTIKYVTWNNRDKQDVFERIEERKALVEETIINKNKSNLIVI